MRIDRSAPTLLQAAAEHVARHRLAAFGGDAEPGDGQRRVALDAVAVEEDLAEQGLGLQLALAGGGEDQPRGLARVLRQALLEFIGRELFAPAQIESQTSTQRRNRLW
ncbi:hypothetical protein D3C78_1621660 [compost metagenome]